MSVACNLHVSTGSGLLRSWQRLVAVMTCAGNRTVVEEFLAGEEASFFALLDGSTCVALASAQV